MPRPLKDAAIFLIMLSLSQVLRAPLLGVFFINISKMSLQGIGHNGSKLEQIKAYGKLLLLLLTSEAFNCEQRSLSLSLSQGV